MNDPNRIPLLEAQLERTALERDEARQVLAELGKENARLRANLAVMTEAYRDHRAALMDRQEPVWLCTFCQAPIPLNRVNEHCSTVHGGPGSKVYETASKLVEKFYAPRWVDGTIHGEADALRRALEDYKP